MGYPQAAAISSILNATNILPESSRLDILGEILWPRQDLLIFPITLLWE
jgi:hypothetical protein